MKTKFLTFLITLFVVGNLFGQTADPLQQFVDQVNAKWKAKDYNAIKQLIDTRLQSNQNDALALGVKAYYYIFATIDLTQARAASQSFNTVVQASSQSSAKEGAQSIKDEIWNIPLSEDGALLPDEQAQYHTLFPDEFPMIKKVLNVARAATSPQ